MEPGGRGETGEIGGEPLTRLISPMTHRKGQQLLLQRVHIVIRGAADQELGAVARHWHHHLAGGAVVVLRLAASCTAAALHCGQIS